MQRILIMILEIKLRNDDDMTYYQFNNKIEDDLTGELEIIDSMTALKEYLQCEEYIEAVLLYNILWDKKGNILSYLTSNRNILITIDFIEQISIISF